MKSGLTDIAGDWVFYGPKHAQPGLRLVVAESELCNPSRWKKSPPGQGGTRSLLHQVDWYLRVGGYSMGDPGVMQTRLTRYITGPAPLYLI